MKSFRFAFVCCRPKAAGYETGPSFIYRCQNLALALQKAGHSAQLAHYSRFDPRQQYDAVVFHRPHYSLGFRLTIRKLRKAGICCIADFDDLVFSPEWAPSSPGVLNGQVSLKQTQNKFTAHQRALSLFQHATVSTEALSKRMQQSHKIIPRFVPNAVHLNWRQDSKTENKPEQPRLTYFPGTRSHDRDFATIREPLEDFLQQHSEVQLQITGDLGNSVNIKTRSNQLLRYAKQDFMSYREHVASSWLNLAPLENTLFNTHKSALKVIEASYFNAPTLATPIPDMRRLDKAGAHLAENPQDWFDGLKQVLQPPVSGSLRSAILTQADAHSIASDYVAELTSRNQA